MPRFNVDFSDEALTVIEDLAKRSGCTKAEVVRRSLLKWFRDTIDSGSKIVVEERDGRLKEVVHL